MMKSGKNIRKMRRGKRNRQIQTRRRKVDQISEEEEKMK
jgi:hypothetical protein